MNNQQIVIIVISCLIALNLILLLALVESNMILRWYRKQFHSEPRVNKCPIKRTWYTKAVAALFTLKLVD